MKEYLLLRNNTELGHYSFEELKAMGLKPFDLIWIENKSFSWKYPSEITELAPFAPSLQLPSVEDLENTGGRLIQMEEKGWPGGHDTTLHDEAIEMNTDFNEVHIVAIKPKQERLRIKTIKSPLHDKIVKVEIREEATPIDKSPMPDAKLNLEQAFNPIQNNQTVIAFKAAELSRSNALTNMVNWLNSNNRMEMIVLIIGAISLLAVIYLFYTSAY